MILVLIKLRSIMGRLTAVIVWTRKVKRWLPCGAGSRPSRFPVSASYRPPRLVGIGGDFKNKTRENPVRSTI